MATYVVPINAYANGSVVGGGDWTNPIATSGNGLAAAGTAPNKVLTLSGATTGTHIFGYVPIAGVNDVEALVRFKLASDVGKQGIVALRYTGNSEATTKGYTLSGSLISSAGQLAIDEGSTGYMTWTPWNYLPNITYWARFRVNGNRMQAKVWTDGNAEPSSWMLDTTNGVQTSGSFSGLHQYRGSNIDYSWISFGTGGDQAPNAQQLRTQIGNMRVEVTTTRTILGNTRIGLVTPRNQPANTRILVVQPRTQIGNTRIQTTVDRTTVGNVRIAIARDMAQSANTRILKVWNRAQPGNTAIRRTVDRDQPASARLANEYLKTQPANTRVTAQPLRDQPGRATINNNVLRQQIGQLAIKRTTDRLQMGNMRIQLITTRILLGNTRLARAYDYIQVGNMRITVAALRNQVGKLAILRQPPMNQPGRMLVAKEYQYPLIGSAFIIRVNDYTKPRIGIVNRRPGVGAHTPTPITAISDNNPSVDANSIRPVMASRKTQPFRGEYIENTLVDDPVALVDDPNVLVGVYIEALESPVGMEIASDIIKTDVSNNKPKGIETWRNSPRVSQSSMTSTPRTHSRRTTMQPGITRSTPRPPQSPRK